MTHTAFRTAYDCLPTQLPLALGRRGHVASGQHSGPAIGYAPVLPVADAREWQAKGFSQSGDAAFCSDGFVKNVHTHDFITTVSVSGTHSHRQNEAMTNVAQRLKEARSLKGWNQAQAAVAAGVSPGTIGNIESGARQAKGSLPQIAKALGVSHDWLANGIGPMVETPVAPVAPVAAAMPSSQALLLATLFDKLDGDVVKRAQVFHHASEAILRELQGTATAQTPAPAIQSPVKKQSA